jgi:hypothetical protein
MRRPSCPGCTFGLGLLLLSLSSCSPGCRARGDAQEGACCSLSCDSTLLVGCFSDCASGLICEPSDSVCWDDSESTDGTCRRQCETNYDCPDDCECLEGVYNWQSGDMNPNTCRGGWGCGGFNQYCRVGTDACNDAPIPLNCVMESDLGGGTCRPPGPKSMGQICGTHGECGMGLGCPDGECRFLCQDDSRCSTGEVCINHVCMPSCEPWAAGCPPSPGGRSTECRPAGHRKYCGWPELCDGGWDGKWGCMTVGTRTESEMCGGDWGCRSGLRCTKSRCRRYCDPVSHPCDGDRPCLPRDAGPGLCGCPGPGVDAGLDSCLWE